ncbi:MAG: hypothetical protein R3341_02740 [Methylophaga sp.]|nr:hypothetical protein [Methylophaga sp.]
MKQILLLALMMAITHFAMAETQCADANNELCIVVHSAELECHKSSVSGYLSHCIASVAYDVSNDAKRNIEAKASCKVEINYLKSVMGIRDTDRQQNSQIDHLLANSKNRFTIPVEFNFSTQIEANNAEIKSVNCRIASTLTSR